MYNVILIYLIEIAVNTIIDRGISSLANDRDASPNKENDSSTRTMRSKTMEAGGEGGGAVGSWFRVVRSVPRHHHRSYLEEHRRPAGTREECEKARRQTKTRGTFETFEAAGCRVNGGRTCVRWTTRVLDCNFDSQEIPRIEKRVRRVIIVPSMNTDMVTRSS